MMFLFFDGIVQSKQKTKEIGSYRMVLKYHRSFMQNVYLEKK